jgi:hypothetical protein
MLDLRYFREHSRSHLRETPIVLQIGALQLVAIDVRGSRFAKHGERTALQLAVAGFFR